MLEKLKGIEKNFLDLEQKLMDPNVTSDIEAYQRIAKEHADLTPIVELYRSMLQNQKILDEDKEMLEISEDDEMSELMRAEIQSREETIAAQEEEMKMLLLPTDPNDHKNVIVEIRAGAGGDEAGLFAGDLYRMYVRYAERHNWNIDVMSMSEQGIGGVKEANFRVRGKGADSKMKY